MNYSVTGEQLTGIADAIRAKANIDPSEPYASLGKNLLNPETLEVTGLPIGHYTFSAKALGASQGISYFGYTYGTQPVYEEIPAHEAGERVSFVINLQADVELAFSTSVSYTDYQLESGDEATSFEPYVIKLMFPDGFTSEIGNLVDLTTATSDANAVASDIKSGKTAYVNGSKITGSYVPRMSSYQSNVQKTKVITLPARSYSANMVVDVISFTNLIVTSDTINVTITGDHNDKFGYLNVVGVNAHITGTKIKVNEAFTSDSEFTISVSYTAFAEITIS